MFETLLEQLFDRFVEDGLPILVGAAGAAASALLGALAGYVVYKAVVTVLDRTNIKEVIANALADMKERVGQKKTKAHIKEIIVANEGKAGHVKLDILDSLSGSQEAELEIEFEEIRDIQVGDVIEDIYL